MEKQSEFRDVQSFRNDTDEPLEMMVEPWGRSIELPAGEVFRFEARSSREGRLEFCKTEWGFAVLAWPGGTMKVYKDGEIIADFGDNLVPDLPEGMIMREFLSLVFGMRDKEAE